MLTTLTKYLLQYKRVSIPDVGTFELVQQPARLDIADKLFAAPVFTLRFLDADRVPEHQLAYLSQGNAYRATDDREQLAYFGQKLRTRITSRPFEWNGFGTLRYESSRIVFDPAEIRLASLQTIPAQKVIRQNAAHQVLVGDREVSSHQVSDVMAIGKKKMPLVLIMGWVLFFLAILAIILVLYFGKFQTHASGLKTPAVGYFSASRSFLS